MLKLLVKLRKDNIMGENCFGRTRAYDVLVYKNYGILKFFPIRFICSFCRFREMLLLSTCVSEQESQVFRYY